MKLYGGVDVLIHVFLTLEPVGGEWSASRRSPFTLGEIVFCTHWKGGWVGLIAGLEAVKRRRMFLLPELELRPLGRPALSQDHVQGPITVARYCKPIMPDNSINDY
jgi:hypothetical protein